MKEHISNHLEQNKNQLNPFSAEHSGYGVVQPNGLTSVYVPDNPLFAFHAEAHESFRDFVLDPDFACIAGQAAVRTDNYAFCAYEDMTSPRRC